MKNLLIILLASLLFSSCHIVETDNDIDNITSLPVIQAYIQAENYSFLLENKMSDVSVPASLYINDKQYKCLIKSQGAGSRLYPKWNYFIELENKSSIYGVNYFNLSAQVVDPTFIRTPLALHLYNQLGFNTFTAMPVFLRINENQNGLYLLIEKIDESYFTSRNLPVAELIKVAFGATFTFKTKNYLPDNFEKKIPDDNNFNNLADFINALDTTGNDNIFSSLGKMIDIKMYLRYHAFNTIINNSDGLTNNYYFYKKTPHSPFTIIPWDFDKAFDYKINLKLYGENDIIKALFRNDSCKVLYKQEMKNILEKYFTEENLFPVIDENYNKIKSVYNFDPWLKMNGYNLEKEVSELKNFIISRRIFLLKDL